MSGNQIFVPTLKSIYIWFFYFDIFMSTHKLFRLIDTRFWWYVSLHCQTFKQSFSSHFNLSPLSPTGLQHPRQRRAALSGTLQPTSRPPWTGKSSAITMNIHIAVSVLLHQKCSAWVLHRPNACLNATTSTQGWPFTRLCVVRSIRQPPITLNHDHGGLKSFAFLFLPESKVLHVNKAVLCGEGWRGWWHGRNVLGLSFTSPAWKSILIWKRSVVGKCWVAWS